MFYLKALPVSGNARAWLAEICLGEHVEACPLITTLWSVDEYRQQWRRAVEALVAGAVRRCMLITDLQPPHESAGLTYWALFEAGGQEVVAQERLMRVVPVAVDLQIPEDVEPLIPPRLQGTPEEHALVSEWTVSVGDLRAFLAEKLQDFGSGLV